MLSLNDTYLTLKLERPSKFHYIWLRDNCRCSECLHPDTRERILISHTIPANIAPESAQLKDGSLEIIWNQGGHRSRYSQKWLTEHNYDAGEFISDIAAAEPVLWNKSLQDSIPTFDYSDIRDHDGALLAWCEAIRDVGLTIVRGAPNKSGEIERFAERVAFVRETIYDRVHTVRATPGEYNAYNVASTSLELKPHTDMPVYDQPPGIQMFHFLVNESSGGNSTAVDGFYVAERLKEVDPEAFSILASTPLDFRMNSARGDVQAKNPILSLDVTGRLKVFRYSNQLAQPARIPSDAVERFYRAYQLLGRMLEDPDHMVEFRLNTGDMMATNNLRVLHGRKAFDPTSGDRHLQLTYMDMDDVLSRIRMIKNSAQVH